MDTDDLEPLKPKAQKRNLEPMSVEELRAYIAELEVEIARVEADIERKTKHRAGAENLFKRT